jgi:hypothetical protein
MVVESISVNGVLLLRNFLQIAKITCEADENTMGYRMYVRTDQGLRRLPLTSFEKGRAFPQYAGTRQPVISAFTNGRIEGTSLLHFDADGRGDGLALLMADVKIAEANKARKQTLRTNIRHPVWTWCGPQSVCMKRNIGKQREQR